MSILNYTTESTDSLLSSSTDVASPLPVSLLSDEEKLQKIADAYKTILECIGEDPNREGLKDTPMRAAKALQFFSKGYNETVKEKVGTGIFSEDNLTDDLILVKNIEFFSHCEHHLVPFYGVIHIAYQPKDKILGLSKLARIVEVYSRRFQVQERLGREVATAIEEAVGALGVAVMIEASHMCMVMRGVEKTSASTTTTTFLGSIKKDKDLRKEFFSMLNTKK